MQYIIRLIAILLFLQISPIVCLSQNHTIDSLIAIIKSPKEDTNKLNALNLLSSYLLKSEQEKSYRYANQSLELAQKLNLKKYINSAYQNIAGYYYYKGNIKLASEYVKKEFPLIEQTNNQHALSDIYSNLSVLYIEQNDYVNAMDYSRKALQIAEQLKDSSSIATILGNTGVIYGATSDYSTALSYFLRSLKINEAQNDKRGMEDNYSRIGKLYHLEAYYDKAFDYCQLSLKYAKELDDKLGTALVLNELGSIYNDNKNYALALTYFQQALSLYQQLGNITYAGSCIGDIATTYGEYGQYNKAIDLMNKAVELSKGDVNKGLLGKLYESLGAIYILTKKYDTAVFYLNQGIKITKAIGEKNNEATSLFYLAECYQGLNNYKSAFNTLMQCKLLNDSTINNEMIKKTSELEASYNFERKEKEITLLTKNEEVQKLQIKKQSLLQKFLIGGIVILSILFFFIYRNYHIRQLLRLQVLRNKIASDLHDDIGSTLSSISMFTLMAREGSKEVIPMLDQIGEYSRNMLESMADIVWSINPSNDNFEKIVYRMSSFAFELLRVKNIDFEFNVDDSIDNIKLSMEQRKNLYLIFKEATNNMVKYSQASNAIFTIELSKNILTLLIRDNGKGFDIQKTTLGNGLKNMKNRALEMGGQLLIESEPGIGTTIRLLFKTTT